MRKQLLEHYESKKLEIKKRLKEFSRVCDTGDKRIFAELCFCICTPRSSALRCDEAIRMLTAKNLLFSGTANRIVPFLHKVNYYKRKAEFIVEAREKFTVGGRIRIKKFIEEFLETNSAQELREWVDDNVKGIGMKEASHFLRNIGIGNFAILDVHILKEMKQLGVINEIPESMNRLQYLEIEEKMKAFSKSIGIPLKELDLVLWSKETGFVFK